MKENGKKEKYTNKMEYVRAVVKRVQCSSVKKKEIEKQLLSDITAAEEAGGNRKDILESMGSAAEMAEEFNSNLSEDELKRYKRQKAIKIASIVIILIIGLIIYVYWLFPKTVDFGTSGLFEEQEVENQIKWVVHLIEENECEALKKVSVEEMKKLITETLLKQSKDMVSDDWGEFKEFGNLYLTELKQKGQSYAVGQVTVSYENVSVTYLVTLDKELKLAGFYIR